jgi:hypothetical protein
MDLLEGFERVQTKMLHLKERGQWQQMQERFSINHMFQLGCYSLHCRVIFSYL